MEMWNRTSRWLRLNEDKHVPSPGRETNGENQKDDEANTVDQGPVVENLSSSEQKKYWAREQRRLRAVLRRLDTGGEPELCRDPDSGVSVSFDGDSLVQGRDGRVKRNVMKRP